jgi:hypothetical protein
MLYREDLDELICCTPGCTEDHSGPLYYHPKCHPHAGTLVVMHRGSDHIHVICMTCEKPVVEIAVASRPDLLARRGGC